MYIKSQTFSDIETLIEQLFDFGLGEPSPIVAELMKQINEALLADKDFQAYKNGIEDEEEAMELEDDAKRELLAKELMQQFQSFVVEQHKLYGLVDGKKTELYTIDF